jgi:hypothetical protein
MNTLFEELCHLRARDLEPASGTRTKSPARYASTALERRGLLGVPILCAPFSSLYFFNLKTASIVRPRVYSTAARALVTWSVCVLLCYGAPERMAWYRSLEERLNRFSTMPQPFLNRVSAVSQLFLNAISAGSESCLIRS